MSEQTVLENDEKWIIITKNGKKWQGANCNRVVVYDNLTTRRITAWLNGHVIIDTGIQQKIDLIDYFFLPVEQAQLKYSVITKFNTHELRLVNNLLADDVKEYVCSCGDWRFFGKDEATLMFIEHITLVK